MPADPAQHARPTSRYASMRSGSILDVRGLRLEHATHTDARTGCSVLLCDQPATAGVDIRGGGPATRELDLLSPSAMVERIDAVLFTGGSAPGLAAADGVVRWLRNNRRGFPTPQGPIPIVPACAIFDLAQGDPNAAPTNDDGSNACEDAHHDHGASRPIRGSIGAGTGAVVGKVRGHQHASAGGVGSASWTSPGGVHMGAFVVLNALGDVIDPDTGRVVCGARTDGNRPLHTERWLIEHTGHESSPLPKFGRTNTTLAVVATDAPLTKAEATRIAMMASTGMARAVNPCHSPYDGDVVIALSTAPDQPGIHAGTTHAGIDPAAILHMGAMAACVLTAAVLDAAWSAESRPGLPNAGELGWTTR